jgi:hypothetical protein
MKRWAILLMVVALLVGSSYAQKVSISFVKSTDFAKYKTYAWKPGHTLGKSQILPMEAIDKLVLSMVKPLLADKGLKEVTSDPDAYVTYFISLTQKSEVGPLNQFDTYGKFGYEASEAFGGAWNESMVTSYRKGILLIDLVDARTNTLIWRAHCKEATDKPGDAKTALNKAVTKAFSDFPPKTTK